MANPVEQRRTFSVIELGEVVDVNNIKYHFDVRTFSNNRIIQGVRTVTDLAAAHSIAWSGSLPPIGTCVAIAKTSNGEWLSLGCVNMALPAVTDPLDPASSETDSRDDYSAGRAPRTPGGWSAMMPNGARFQMTPDGTFEVAIVEDLFLRMFPDSHAVQMFARNIAVEGLWGRLRSHVQAEPTGDDRNPTYVEAWYRSQAQNAPHVHFAAGAIPQEKGRQLQGARTVGPFPIQSVCLRMAIFDEETASNADDMGVEPDIATARAVILADQEGNVQTVLGTWDIAVKDMILLTRGSLSLKSLGSIRVESQGDVRLETGAGMYVSARKSVLAETSGDFVLRCRKFIVEAQNDAANVVGPYKVQSGGAMQLGSDAGVRLSAGGDFITGAAGDRVDKTSGRHIETIGGGAEPENQGRDFTAKDSTILAGSAVNRVVKGSWSMQTGPPLTPISRLKIHGSVLEPTKLGRLEYNHWPTLTRLTVQPGQGVYVGNPAGNIRSNAAGQFAVGPDAGPMGYVVTTLSHVCYVTGLPPRGSTQMAVAQMAPGVPTPAIPVVPVPPTPPPVPIPSV